MLSSKLLSKATEDSGRRYWFNRFLERVKNSYRAVLKWVLGHRKTTVFGTMAIIVGSLALIPMIGASFMPSSDQGQLQVNIETQSGSSLEHMQSVTEDVNEKLAAYDDVIDVS